MCVCVCTYKKRIITKSAQCTNLKNPKFLQIHTIAIHMYIHLPDLFHSQLAKLKKKIE